MIEILHPITSTYCKSRDKTKYKIQISFNKKNSVIFQSKKIPKTKLNKISSNIELLEAEDHLDDLYLNIINKIDLKKNSKITAFSYKDNTLLDRFKKNEFEKCNTLKFKKNKYVHSIIENFIKFKIKNKFDLFIIRHAIEHSYDINKLFKKIYKSINDDGYILVEIPDSSRLLKNGDCSMIWEEHTYYFTKNSFSNFIQENDFHIVFKKRYKYPYEDCLTFLLKKNDKKNKVNYFSEKNYLKIFSDKLNQRKKKIQCFFKKIYKDHPIVFFGAGHLSSTFINLMEIEKFIDFVLDGDKNKNNTYLPGTDLKIKILDKKFEFENQIFFLSMNPIRINNAIDSLNFPKNTKFFSIFKGNKYSIDKYF